MSIENYVSSLEDMLKRPFHLLIVDDSPANREAALAAASDLGIADRVTVLSSEKESIDYLGKNRPSYVISDMEMEDKVSGLYVSEAAFSKGVFPIIATGINMDRSEADAHGPATTVIPMDMGIKIRGKKDRPEVWRELIEKSLRYFSEDSRGADRIGYVSSIFNVIIDEARKWGWSEDYVRDDVLGATVGIYHNIYTSPVEKLLLRADLARDKRPLSFYTFLMGRHL